MTLKRTATRAAMQGIGSVEFLTNIPIRDFLDIIEEIVKENNRRKNKKK